MNYEFLYGEFPRLENESVILKKIEKSDLKEFFEMHSNEEIFRYIPGKPKKNIKSVENLIDHYERDFNKRKMIFLGIYSKKLNKLVGMLEIFEIDKKTDSLTFGYRLHPDYWGMGLATISTKMIIDYLFKEVEVNRIQAFVMVENTKSSKVLERCDFVYEGTIRQGQLWKDIGLVDLKLYSRLKEEYCNI